MREALGSVLSTAQAGCGGGAPLSSQYSVGRGRGVGKSRPVLATEWVQGKVWDREHMKPCLKKGKSDRQLKKKKKLEREESINIAKLR